MSCCICDGNCNHSGPHHYCPEHDPHNSFKGWECPRCGRFLNPRVKYCDCTLSDLKFSFDDIDLVKGE